MNEQKSRRQVVIDALQHRGGADARVPHNIELTSELLEKFCVLTKIDKAEYFEYARNHIEKAGYTNKGEYIKPGFFKDEFGVVWNRSGVDKDIGVLDDLIFSEPEFGDFVFPEPDLELVRHNTETLLNNGRDTFKIGQIGFSFFERAWSMRGFENLLMDFLTEEEFAHELLGKILDYNKKILSVALEYDIDGVYFGDDYGSQRGLIMGPEIWRRFIKPGLAEMFAMVKSKGKFVLFHSCGDISDILEDMVEIGLDAYQTVQPEIYDLKILKQKFGGRLTFWGAISTQKDMPFVSPAELQKIVRDTIEILSVGGGYIAAPTHAVPADVPVENIVTMIEEMKRH
ncbi:MAG: uroporphyrinogen decarboxylase family protein [Bacillota bacterium]